MGRDDLPLYTVNYQYSGTVPANAPELPNGGSYAEGSTVGVAQDLTLEGYEFSGWSTSDVSVSNGTFTMPGGNVTFYGSFVAKETHDVIYTVTGETPTGYEPPQTASYGAGDDVEMDSLKAGDEVNGYRFSGWTTTSSIDITDGICQKRMSHLREALRELAIPLVINSKVASYQIMLKPCCHRLKNTIQAIELS